MENASQLPQGSASSEPIEILLLELARDKPKRFSREELVMFTRNFATKIGGGTYGTVYKGQFLNGIDVAVKVLAENSVTSVTFMAEVRTMGWTFHRNLVKLYGYCSDANTKALVYEYMKNGSLDKFLYGSQCSIKWEKLYDIAVQTAKGLLYLHDGCDNQIIHFDIKPANVLLLSDLSPKITDFGLAKLMNRNVSHLPMTRIIGTPGYAAPETYIFSSTSKLTPKCDVYSFGMMLFDILDSRKNMQSELPVREQVWEKFKERQLDEIIKDCGIGEENRQKAEILCTVALWCIQFTPKIRPCMNTVSMMLEKKIQVNTPPNPFFPSESNCQMQPSQTFTDEMKSIISKPSLQESTKNIVQRPSTSSNFRELQVKKQGTEPPFPYLARNQSKQSSTENKVETPPWSKNFGMPGEKMQVTAPLNWSRPFDLSGQSSTERIIEVTHFGMDAFGRDDNNLPDFSNLPDFMLNRWNTTPKSIEPDVTQWHRVNYTVNKIDSGVVRVHTNSNLELVIEGFARKDDPNKLIVTVLPRPKLMKNMNFEEIQQLLSQCTEGIRLIISRAKPAFSARAEYWNLYKVLAFQIPSLMRIKDELREMD